MQVHRVSWKKKITSKVNYLTLEFLCSSSIFFFNNHTHELYLQLICLRVHWDVLLRYDMLRKHHTLANNKTLLYLLSPMEMLFDTVNKGRKGRWCQQSVGNFLVVVLWYWKMFLHWFILCSHDYSLTDKRDYGFCLNTKITKHMKRAWHLWWLTIHRLRNLRFVMADNFN